MNTQVNPTLHCRKLISGRSQILLTLAGLLLLVAGQVKAQFTNVIDAQYLLWTTGGATNWVVDTTTKRDGVSSVRSGTIAENQTNFIQTTITGPTTVRFNWKVSSESCCDQLVFYVDGVPIGAIAGEIDWQLYTTNLSSGVHTLKWVYSKDGSLSYGSDAGWLDSLMYYNTNTTQSAAFSQALHGYSGLTYYDFSGTVWGIDNSILRDGQAVKSGAITHSQLTSFSIPDVAGNQTVSWWWKVSSELNWDKLKFIVDGVEVTQISGEVAWQMTNYTLGTGLHLLVWRYEKDSTASSGSDAGWIDSLVINHRPIINAQPVAQTINYGANASFSVAAVATPSAAYQWKKDGVALVNGGRISGANAASLTLTGAISADAGSYTVEVTNSFGLVTSSSVALTVVLPPSITTQPVSQTINQGNGVTFSVTVSGSSPFGYQWQKGGVTIPGATNSSYLISGVTGTDAASYTVVVTNVAGTATSSAAVLTVNTYGSAVNAIPYTWTTGGNANWMVDTMTNRDGFAMRSGIIGDNQSNFLQTTVTGPAQISFYWKISSEAYDFLRFYVDGVLWNGIAGTADWALGTVAIAAGNHTLKWEYAKNGSGSFGFDAGWVDQVSFVIPPSITIAPVSQTVNQSNNVTFNVTVSGTSPFGYQWQKGGVNISDATNSSYLISGVTGSDAASYTVVVTNAAGTATSSAAVLTVNTYGDALNAPAYTWTTGGNANWTFDSLTNRDGLALRSGIIGDNQASYLQTTITGPAQVRFYWKVSSEMGYDYLRFLLDEVPQGGGLSGTVDWSYAMFPIPTGTHSLKWLYSKDLSVAVGLDAGWLDQVTVDYPPIITQQPTGTNVNLGAGAAFRVVATGSAPISYQWRKNAVNITNATNATLYISSTTLADAATYSVVVNNLVGGVTSSGVDLVILPAIIVQPQSQVIGYGNSVVFSVTASGTALTYQWKKGGAILAGATNATHTIATVQDNDVGSFTVEVSNSGGLVASTAASLTVLSLGQALNATNLTWNCFGAANWRVVTNVTRDTMAVQNGTLPDNNGTVLETTITGPAYLTFYWKASTSDYLRFVVDTVIRQERRVDMDWEYQTIVLGAGSHQVQWTYAKDTAPNSGSDCAWVDQVTVYYPPGISVQPVGQAVDQGSGLTLNVTGTSTLPISYQWLKNGAAIISATNATYFASNVTTTNAGNYTVVLNNSAGSVTSVVAAVSINTPPVITAQPVSQLAGVGGFATLTVAATGVSPLSYQWKKGGVVIAGAGNASYTINPVAMGDAGTYTVLVSNRLGTAASGNAVLTVSALPVVLTHPTSVIATQGNTVNFSTLALGALPLSYQWRIDGVAIAAATNTSLSLNNVTSNNVGGYQLIITNAFGAATSMVANLAVLSPAYIAAQPQSQLVIQPNTATYNVAAGGNPIPTYQWRLNGGNLGGATNAVYSTPVLTTNNAANLYSVVVSNPLGSVTSSTAGLTIWVPPIITTTPTGVIIIVGGSNQVRVAAGGDTPLGYQWQQNGQNIVGATNPTLIITNARATQSGQYRAIVTNRAGTNYSLPVIISVMYPPSMAVAPVSTVARVGATASFSVQAAGSPVIAYKWQFNGVFLAQGSNNVLELPKVTMDNVGWYTVRVTNLVGTVESASPVFLSLADNLWRANGWGDSTYGQANIPPNWTNMTALSAGGWHTLALSGEGRVLAIGDDSAQQCDVPFGLTDVVAVAAGGSHSLALRNDARVVSWGDNSLGQSTVPVTLSNVVALAAGTDHSLALKHDGTVVAWGANDAGQTTVPASLAQVKAVSAGNKTSFALRRDGTLVYWGNTSGFGNVTNGIKAMDAGLTHVVLLLTNGMVTNMGGNLFDQGNVPAGLSNVVAVSAGGEHSMALKADGTVVAWGAGANGVMDSWPDYGQATVPANLQGVVAIAAGGEYSVVLRATPPVFLTHPQGTNLVVGLPLELSATLKGSELISYQWFKGGFKLIEATNATLSVAAVHATNAGAYTLVASNIAGCATSGVAIVTVLSPPTFVSNITNTTVVLGSGLTFAPSVGGTVPIAYQWRKNGADLAGATQSTLTLSNVSYTDMGEYFLMAANTIGAVTSQVAQVTVVAPPGILQPPVSQEVMLNASFSLSAEVTGTEPLAYAWYKGGILLDGVTNSMYLVSNAQTNQSGTYYLVVTNLYGSMTSALAVVTVYAPPSVAVTNSPATNRIAVGQNLVLSITNLGTGPFIYEWRLNGDPIAHTVNAQLVLTNLSPTDAGEYSVVVSNYAGTFTLVVNQLTVVGPPIITSDLVSQIAVKGSNVMFSITAAGEPPLSYAWTKDGEVLPGVTGSKLNLNSLNFTNAGTYQVRVGNAAGSVTGSNAVLIVAEWPSIVVDIVDQTLDLGQDFTLSVTAAGTAPLRYQWLQNGQVITGATNDSLSIYGVNVAAAGLYSVEVANAVRSVVSRSAVVVVRAAPRLAVTPKSQLAALGDTLDLRVTALGNEPFDFRWFKEGLAISGATNNTLVMSNLDSSHSGTYSLAVTNAFGWDLAEVVTLNVIGPPIISRQPENVLVVPGDPAAFEVAVSGMGDLIYEWTKDGILLPNATGPQLNIASVSLADAGKYRVTVSCEGGRTVSQEASLAFHGLPAFQTQPRDLVVYTDEVGELLVEVNSTLAVGYYWLKNGQSVGGSAASLQVGAGQLSVENNDVFTVIVSNRVGTAISKPALVQTRSRNQAIPSAGAHITQAIRLQPGWNAIYFEMQPDSNTVQEVFGALPWSSVWTWRNRNSTVQYIQEVSEGNPDQTEWLVHFRTNRVESFNNNLVRIFSHRPYLVHIDGSNAVSLMVTGVPGYKPINWVPDSYNLTGLPVDEIYSTCENFFRYSPAHYDTNTSQVRALYELATDGHWQLMNNTNMLRRGAAYWVYCKGASVYNGTFGVQLSMGTGLDFGSKLDQLALDLINCRNEAGSILFEPFGMGTNWPVAMRLVNHEGINYIDMPNPYALNLSGLDRKTLDLVPQRAKLDGGTFETVFMMRDAHGTMHLLPVIVRANSTNNSAASIALAGGSMMSLANGARVADNSLTVSAQAGLWVGNVTLKSVSEINGVITLTNRLWITNELGQVTNVVTYSYTNNPMTPAPTPVDAELDVRLIVHVDAGGQAKLLKEVFQLWEDGTYVTSNGVKTVATPGKYVLLTDRRLLTRFKGSTMLDGEQVGRRISSAVYVFDGEDAVRNYVAFSGNFEPGGRVATSFGLSANAPLNPFRHKYHPDHDNLSADFKTFKAEAYAVTREVTMRMDALPIGKDPAAAQNELVGVYTERLSGLHRKVIATSGDFRLRRISRIADLNPVPTQ